MEYMYYSRPFIRILACLVCLMLLLPGCGTVSQFGSSNGSAPGEGDNGGMAAVAAWRMQPEGFVHDTPVGPFRFLYILNNFGIQRSLLLYAVPGKGHETPQVMSQTPVTKVLSVKELGTVGAFQVGVLDVYWENQTDEAISLTFSFPSSKATWTMSPMKLMRKAEIRPRSEGHGPPKSVVDEAPLQAFNYGGRGLANFEIAMAKGQPQQTPLFVHVEQDNTVTVISEEEFKNFTAPVPITAGPVEPQPTAELPPATYAPTPTLPPYPAPGAAQAYPSPDK